MAKFNGFVECAGTIPHELIESLCNKATAFDWTQAEKHCTDYMFREISTLIRRNKDYRFPFYDVFEPEIDAIRAHIWSCKIPYLQQRRVVITSLATLKPWSSLTKHTDGRLYHSIGERIHVPVVHGEGVEYAFFDEYGVKHTHEVEVGNFYRFNDKVPHSVTNNSDNIRINLIMDYIPNLCAHLTVQELNTPGFTS